MKPEVDGTTQGIAIPSSAALTVEELKSVFGQLPSGVVLADRSIDPSQGRLRGVDEVLARPYRIAGLRLIANRVAAGLNNV